MDRRDRTVRVEDGAIVLPREAAECLTAAMEQMDLLLACEQVDQGLEHLLGLLGCLRDLRRMTA